MERKSQTERFAFFRPIPQWFRLKTDSKIQVRKKNIDNLLTLTTKLPILYSTTLSVVTGGAPSSTSKHLPLLIVSYTHIALAVGYCCIGEGNLRRL